MTPCPDPQTAEATQPRDAKDFNFYGVLEQAPVPPVRPDLEQAPMPPNPLPAAPGQGTGSAGKPADRESAAAKATPVYLQIASFKASADADALKARIALAGVAVEVVTTELPEKGTYYRVKAGPFQDKAEADLARAQMLQAGIAAAQAIVVR